MIMHTQGTFLASTDGKLQNTFINGPRQNCKEIFMTGPHIELIETICNDVLPNMVRIFESKKMNSAMDQDMFVKLLEQKIELANKSLKKLSFEDQATYRVKIDRAYAVNIDRIRKETPVQQTAFVKRIPVDHC
jgi:hypothetical protein